MMNVEAFILIGGRSSRMGRDKAFVEVGGMSLAERTLTTVRDSGIATKITYVAANAKQFAISPSALMAPFIFDLYEGRGPLGGLHAALSYAQTEWIFVLACDYPLVSPEFIAFLAGCISNDFGSVVPEQPDGRLQPLCAVYNAAAARTVVQELIDRPRVSPPMARIVESLTPRIVKPVEYSHLAGSDKFFVNVNTADDLKGIANII